MTEIHTDIQNLIHSFSLNNLKSFLNKKKLDFIRLHHVYEPVDGFSEIKPIAKKSWKMAMIALFLP